VLAETLHDVVLGGRLEEIDRLANAAAAPEVAQARRLLVECGRDIGRDMGRGMGQEVSR
jgi:hypothetical protein